MLRCITDIALILAKWPILDAVIALLWIRRVASAWSGYKLPPEKDGADERNLGATVILAQLNGVLTSASIIVAGVGAFVALAPGPLGTFDLPLLRLAAVFAVIALGTAMYTMGTLPTRAPETNFVRSKEVALLSTIALVSVTFAGIRFMLGIWTYLS